MDVLWNRLLTNFMIFFAFTSRKCIFIIFYELLKLKHLTCICAQIRFWEHEF